MCVIVDKLDAETDVFSCLEGGGFAKASPCPWRCDTLVRGGSGAGVHHDFPGTVVEKRLGATSVRKSNAAILGRDSHAAVKLDSGCEGKVVDSDDTID